MTRTVHSYIGGREHAYANLIVKAGTAGTPEQRARLAALLAEIDAEAPGYRNYALPLPCNRLQTILRHIPGNPIHRLYQTTLARRRTAHMPVAKPCSVCGAPFLPGRADAAVCSNRCRQRRYRDARKSVDAELAALLE